MGKLEESDLVRVKDVRWEVEGYQIADEYFSMEKGMLMTTEGHGFSYIIELFQ
jgi:hypothetical protein